MAKRITVTLDDADEQTVANLAEAVREHDLTQGYTQVAEIWNEVHDTDEAAERRRRYAERVDQAIPA